jgi:catechol 2,3-dioxygenase-like lactoylglutathione lyase family enzyme
MPSLIANVDVPDLERGIDFYTRGLGLAPGRRLASRAVELLGAEIPVFLLEQPAGSAPCAGARRDYRRHWTPAHLDFVVDALEPALARAQAAGARLEGGIVEAAWGRMAVVADPFGNGLCLIQFVGRGYDEMVDGG